MPSRGTPLYEVFAGRDLEGLAYRVVGACRPTPSDFRSYEALGKSYDRHDFFRGVAPRCTTASRPLSARHSGFGSVR